jgi:hypothetical protein
VTPKTAANPASNAPAATRESPRSSDAVAAARATTPSTRATTKTLSQSAHSRICASPGSDGYAQLGSLPGAIVHDVVIVWRRLRQPGPRGQGKAATTAWAVARSFAVISNSVSPCAYTYIDAAWPLQALASTVLPARVEGDAEQLPGWLAAQCP